MPPMQTQTAVPSSSVPLDDPTMSGPNKHEWAGDAYEAGDETDPAAARDWFRGENGAEAWLDKADDGTLTGWVRDADGSVYRYSDLDAWAIDVDHAGMTDAGQGAAAEDPEAEGELDEAADGDLAEEGDDVEGDLEADEDDVEDEPFEDDQPLPEDPADLPAPSAAADVAADEEEEEEEDPLLARLEGKSWPAPGGGRMIARPIRG